MSWMSILEVGWHPSVKLVGYFVGYNAEPERRERRFSTASMAFPNGKQYIAKLGTPEPCPHLNRVFVPKSAVRVDWT
jgi:hypothetical protein